MIRSHARRTVYDGRQLALELVGYAASGLVAVSLTMSSILKLRVINLVGSLAFAVYGALIHSYPVAAMNLFIVGINLYYLRQMLAAREYFQLLEVRPEIDYLRYFLRFHDREIRRFQPAFAHAPAPHHLTFFVLRDAVPARVFIGEVRDGRTLRVLLDYVTPPYRDFKTGRYVFREQAEFFRARGIEEIVSAPGNREHAAYLRRMGFACVDDADEMAAYRLRIAA
ncbi:MAG TPA: hypothetical protein VF746_06340 [Longimicrobium sp.]|jgi:hypothetical protein